MPRGTVRHRSPAPLFELLGTKASAEARRQGQIAPLARHQKRQAFPPPAIPTAVSIDPAELHRVILGGTPEGARNGIDHDPQPLNTPQRRSIRGRSNCCTPMRSAEKEARAHCRQEDGCAANSQRLEYSWPTKRIFAAGSTPSRGAATERFSRISDAQPAPARRWVDMGAARMTRCTRSCGRGSLRGGPGGTRRGTRPHGQPRHPARQS